jgi:hypothetical protein
LHVCIDASWMSGRTAETKDWRWVMQMQAVELIFCQIVSLA